MAIRADTTCMWIHPIKGWDLLCNVSIDRRVLVTNPGGERANSGDPVLLLLFTASIKHILSIFIRLCVREYEVSVNRRMAQGHKEEYIYTV